jgi:hypothetical protein
VGKVHKSEKKTAQPKSETNVLATQKKINTINIKQTPTQSSTQNKMDIWNSAQPLVPPLPLRFLKTDLETLSSVQRGISRPFLWLCRHVYILSQMEVEGIQTGCGVIVAKGENV